MPTTVEQSNAATSQKLHSTRKRDALQVSAYEQTSGLLLACLVLFGFLAGVMALAWYSTRLWIPRTPPAVTIPKDTGGGAKGDDLGVTPIVQEFDEPAKNELPAAEPKTETPEAISLAASQPEVLADLPRESSSHFGKGKGGKRGDAVGPADGPGDQPGVAPWDRWEVRLNATTTEEYARQLDFFQIELGVAGGGSPDVTYLSHVAAAKPTVRTGNPRDEKRIRFMHRAGPLRDADRRLAAKAGVETEGKVVFQFYTQEMYQKLLALENEALAPRSISAVRHTIFGVREIAGRYEFYVISQEYR